MCRYGHKTPCTDINMSMYILIKIKKQPELFSKHNLPPPDKNVGDVDIQRVSVCRYAFHYFLNKGLHLQKYVVFSF